MFCYFTIIFNGKKDLAFFRLDFKDAGKVRLFFLVLKLLEVEQ